ncbi:hypothetical protein SS1G_07328 [Sclerotinia sclerotiorum 1980 UF-70]|uniref:Nicotinamide N-methyltransferase n=2 Tax=Sclerotinia sclerotiorum (strain ATCC 18683 / 1980 / Ss-1) TaxID=665079 RepID=A7EPS9_SCLS1|nr:hypothetical protein SS1G_07328 [Sclerotinia sclerotiorum 1980 UF-70]APA10232.1 hypothetical protein sscle_06g050020 [Sclerotinia sclerotiorum 1980 UF-70]EDO04845.1 hypothetical protein SS1G_07328 [Sclerotinia sclerotiorum 1980 UF-70]
MSRVLTDKIRVEPEFTEPEDYLQTSLSVLFPDDIQNQHGDRDQHIVYTSPTLGEIILELSAPAGEKGRLLFAHYLWNAGLQLAELFEDGDGKRGGRERWEVTGESVLEVGSGTGLAGIVTALMGAKEVVLSDYPDENVLANLRKNVAKNIEANGFGDVTVQGHEWGVLDDQFSIDNKERFTRVIASDCLWMPWQHENLLKSIRWFLKEDGRAWICAGFHTGRELMRGFFEEEKLAAAGLEIESIYERDANGVEREWVTDRGAEDRDAIARKRWLVIAILKRR